MKTTVEIPDELFRKVKTVAASQGITFKDVLVHSLASELDKIIDIGISDKKTGYPKRKEKAPLQVEYAKLHSGSLPIPEFIKDWDTDPLEILLDDRRKRDDLLLP